MIANTIHINELIGGRIDPLQFHPERMDVIRAIKRGTWKRLKDVAINVKAITTTLSEGEIYVGLENIIGDTGEYISSNEKETVSSAAKFKKGDILFPKLRPYLNKVHRAQFDGCCSTEFHVFEAKDIHPDFLTIMLRSNMVLAQTKHLMTGNTLPRLQTTDVENLLIPYPSIEIQRKIVEIYTNAQKDRINKKQEAEKLLDSIDGYLLDILKVDDALIMRKVKETIKNVSDLIGSRLDVSFYLDKFEMVSTRYPNVRLSTVVDVDPSIKFNQLASDDTISFIPMECIDEKFGEISNYQEITVAKTKGYTKFKENDLLWAKITPCMQNGKSAIARNLTNGVGCGSTEYFVLRPKSDDLLIDYVYLVLRHKKVLEAAQSSFGGSAGQQRVSSHYLRSIRIPCPDIATQRTIIQTVYGMKDNAKQLQKEGNTLLEKAKLDIEKMIMR